MAKSGFTIPPRLAEALERPELKEFDDFMEIVFRIIEGVGEGETGELDNDNVVGYHDGEVGGHSLLKQADTPGAAVPTVTEVEGTASAAYDAATQALIDRQTVAINQLAAALNAFVVVFNLLINNQITAEQLK